jgi:pimeloyl-ACP methyl ester carboxylesterase
MNDSALHTVLAAGLCCTARTYESVRTDARGSGTVTLADTRRGHTLPTIAGRRLAGAPEPFALAGHSMGGYIALEVVRQAPERVALALISSCAGPDTPAEAAGRRRRLELARSGKSDQPLEAAFAMLPSPANRDRADLAAFWSEMAHEAGPEASCTQLQVVADHADSRPLLATIRCPTAVIDGAGDQLISVEHANETASAVPPATLTIVDGARHMPPHEEPGALRSAVCAWLDQAAA